ncbi:MAG: hypothetical protein PF690_02415 [Deltaproteobacteria bacterium]|jgi:hypothetical protein|nr:hypothetical protein [Deltaproteobacteria bacterium]
MNDKRTIVEKQVVARIMIEGNIIINGSVNIDGFDRFSDYVEHNEKNIKIYNGTIDGNKFEFIIIPKKKICYYEPLEEPPRF